MSKFNTESDYLEDNSLTSTISTTESKLHDEKPVHVISNISKDADKSIDNIYTSGSDNTSTDDIKTYGLSKPKRVLIEGILKNG